MLCNLYGYISRFTNALRYKFYDRLSRYIMNNIKLSKMNLMKIINA